MPEPTTTAYAILALLAVRPWTAYELAQQMERSVGAMWSSATSVVYEEPKRLVDRGWAIARRTYTGKRGSTVYEITKSGRAALHEWLDEPGAPPRIDYEALLKLAFADHGSLDGLRANLAAIHSYVDDQIVQLEARRNEYATSGGPHPERLPVIALALRYFDEHAEALRRWVTWADHEIQQWDGVTPSTGAQLPIDAWKAPAQHPVRKPR